MAEITAMHVMMIDSQQNRKFNRLRFILGVAQGISQNFSRDDAGNLVIGIVTQNTVWCARLATRSPGTWLVEGWRRDVASWRGESFDVTRSCNEVFVWKRKLLMTRL